MDKVPHPALITPFVKKIWLENSDIPNELISRKFIIP